MPRSIRDITKAAKPVVGRPPTTGRGTIIGTRWHDDDLKLIDKWRNAHPDKPNRAEAMRRLVRAGLAAVSTEVKVLSAKPRAKIRKRVF
jgi:hypothetical protein